MGNPFCHVELDVPDVAKAKKFYKALFDWSFGEMKVGDDTYTGISVGDGVGGGFAVKRGEGPSQWLPYVLVADVKKSIAKAQKAGATIDVEYMEIPGMGASGVFVDPFGARVGVWQVLSPPSAPEAKKAKKEKKEKKEKKAAKKAKKAAAKAAKKKDEAKAPKAAKKKAPKAAKKKAAPRSTEARKG